MPKYSAHLIGDLPDGPYFMNFDDPRTLDVLAGAAAADGFIKISGKRDVKFGKHNASANGDCVVFTSQIITISG